MQTHVARCELHNLSTLFPSHVHSQKAPPAQPNVSENASELISNSQRANGRRKIFFPPTTRPPPPAPRISKLEAKVASEVAIFGAPRSPDSNIEIRGAGYTGGGKNIFRLRYPGRGRVPTPGAMF